MVTVNVLSNDVDPDGDSLTLEGKGIETATPARDAPRGGFSLLYALRY